MLEPAEIQGRPVGSREKAHRAAGGQGCPFPGLSRAPHSPPAPALPSPACLTLPPSRPVCTWGHYKSCLHMAGSPFLSFLSFKCPHTCPPEKSFPEPSTTSSARPGLFPLQHVWLKAACAHLPHACTSRVLAGGAPRRPHSSAHPSSARPGPTKAREAGAAGKQRAGKAARHPSNLATVTSPRASLSKSPAPGTRQCSRGRMHSLCGTLSPSKPELLSPQLPAGVQDSPTNWLFSLRAHTDPSRILRAHCLVLSLYSSGLTSPFRDKRWL